MITYFYNFFAFAWMNLVYPQIKYTTNLGNVKNKDHVIIIYNESDW